MQKPLQLLHQHLLNYLAKNGMLDTALQLTSSFRSSVGYQTRATVLGLSKLLHAIIIAPQTAISKTTFPSNVFRGKARKWYLSTCVGESAYIDEAFHGPQQQSPTQFSKHWDLSPTPAQIIFIYYTSSEAGVVWFLTTVG